jgi:hypothetical protein
MMMMIRCCQMLMSAMEPMLRAWRSPCCQTQASTHLQRQRAAVQVQQLAASQVALLLLLLLL